jgi:GT2 family glycosyltransferase
MYDYIGDFDEIFYPAYYEDSDYLYRMKLKGIRQDVEAELNPQTVRISMTQERDPELVNASMEANRLRYIEKWGNSPLLETFLTPYNK